MKSGGGEKRPDLVVVELGGADSGGGVDTRLGAVLIRSATHSSRRWFPHAAEQEDS